MTNELKYPYKLVNIFVVSISLRRDTQLAPKVELPTEIGIRQVEPEFPRLQVSMKVSSPQDTPVSFSLEVVGLFDYIGPKKEYDRALNKEFVQERASHMLFVYCTQLIRLVSGQLGMNPLQLGGPISFDLSQAVKSSAEKKARSKKVKNPA